MISGFESVTSGDLMIRGKRVNDQLPEKRPTSMIFQNYALFPHMTVAENIAFGLQMLGTPKASVKATVGEMMAVARGEVAGTLVWDARSPGERGGDINSTGATNSTCGDVADIGNDTDTAETVGCKTAMNGTVKGAKNLNYISLLVTDDATEDLNNADGVTAADASYRYLDKATLATMVSDLGYTAGKTVYTYCRTTYRAMITGTTSGVILGYPTRYYDGAMIEWLQMASYANHEGGLNLPVTSPWQTAALTDNLTYNSSAYVDVPIITDAYATSTDKVVEADRAYKAGSTSTSSPAAGSTGGVTIPANPCGG